MRRKWLRDDHTRGWVLYEVADDALPGLEAMEGRVLGKVTDDLLTGAALPCLVEDEIRERGWPPLPDEAWPDADALDGDPPPDGRFDRLRSPLPRTPRTGGTPWRVRRTSRSSAT